MIYLDNAATTFIKPDSVSKAMLYSLRNLSSPGRGSYKNASLAGEVIYSAREALARLFNIENPENIIFTDNATTSINTALKGLISPGDSFMISSMEHNAVARPSHLLSQKGAHLYVAEGNLPGFVTPESVLSSLKPDIKLLCLIHSSNVTGSINDLEKIGKELKKRNILFMVDASQSAGSVPIDVEKMSIDILAFPGHKGLFGPQGTGGLYIREGLLLDPLTEGGTGSFSESLSQPEILPDRFESGTPNVPGIAGLLSGVKFILKEGVKNIYAHEKELLKTLYEDLSSIPSVKIAGDPLGNSSAVLSVVTRKDSSLISKELYKNYGVCVRAGLHCAPLAHKTIGTIDTGTVRFSPGYFNTKAEMKKAAFALSKCLK